MNTQERKSKNSRACLLATVAIVMSDNIPVTWGWYSNIYYVNNQFLKLLLDINLFFHLPSRCTVSQIVHMLPCGHSTLWWSVKLTIDDVLRVIFLCLQPLVLLQTANSETVTQNFTTGGGNKVSATNTYVWVTKLLLGLILEEHVVGIAHLLLTQPS
jgi:hypothetical protein